MTVIADRTLFLEHKTETTPVVVRVFRPEFDQAGWQCRCQIDWPHGIRQMRSGGFDGGFDAMQAFTIALQMIGAEIYKSPDHQGGKLYRERPGGGMASLLSLR